MSQFVSVWNSWYEGNTQTKIMALLFIALFVIWLKEHWTEHEIFAKVTLFSAMLCLFPVTAVILGIYQTPFYAYSWIWNLVPVLPMVAYAATLLLQELWTDKQMALYVRMGITVFAVCILALCGNFGEIQSVEVDRAEHFAQTREVLEQVKTLASEKDIQDLQLWAPEEILESARITNPEILLYYGRDMWEEPLGFFTDDRYTQEQKQDYLWMHNLADDAWQGETEDYRGPKQIRNALKSGVNVILLPENTDERILHSLKVRFRKDGQHIDEYYLYVFTADEVHRLNG